MKIFMCYFGLLSILAFNLRAIEFHSMNYKPNNYLQISDKIINRAEELWNDQFESFIDVVSRKIVDKLEKNISDDKISNRMLILLQNDAEIFDLSNYKGHNMALIQSLFFRKLRDKFNNSYIGQKIRKLGSYAKKKVLSLYEKHKEKMQHFFKIMLKAFVIPIAVKYIKKHINEWKNSTLKASDKIDEASKKIAVPIIEKVYSNFEDIVDDYAKKNKVNFNDEMDALNVLIKDKKDMEKLEEEEEAILAH